MKCESMTDLSLEQREKLDKWLGASGELYVFIHRVHAASSGEGYFCRTTNEIDELLIAQTWPELEVHIFRRVQFSLRGIFDEALLADASKEIPDGEYFHIVSLDDYYPSECVWRGGGDSH